MITHAYENKTGLHYLTGLLRVYYLPFIVVYNQCIFPSIFPTLPPIRFVVKVHVKLIYVNKEIHVKLNHLNCTALF